MIKHLFKIIWNKKKKNFLLLCEMFISFLVMFAVFTLIVNYYRSYKTSMGFTDQNVWAVNFDSHHKFATADSAQLFYETLRRNIQELPQVKEVSFCGNNYPFANSTSNTDINFNGKRISSVNFYRADARYLKTLDVQLLEGRWFDQQDLIAAHKPIVINATLKKEIAGNGPAVGQIIEHDDAKEKMRVIGVIADMKDKGDYYLSGKGMYNPYDSSSYMSAYTMLIKVTPDANAAFESRLYKLLTGYMKEASVEIEQLSKKRDSMNLTTLIPVIVFLTIAGFLIINVALGLFGVLWYNINQRKGEIGLRRAIGASGRSVSGQILAEAMVLATLSVVLGTFFAIQFPLLRVLDIAPVVYITAIILAILFIYLLVIVCSLYPGKQAAAILPAVALHEE
jgi:putative ABC transport system permease protein